VNLMWVDPPTPHGTQVVSVEHTRSSDYRIYRWMTDRGWEQVTASMNHKQAEEYWSHIGDPKPVTADMASWLDVEVADLTRAVGGAR
jgi:hypothetical protein